MKVEKDRINCISLLTYHYAARTIFFFFYSNVFTLEEYKFIDSHGHHSLQSKLWKITKLLAFGQIANFVYRGNNWHFSLNIFFDIGAADAYCNSPEAQTNQTLRVKNGEFPFGRIAANTTSLFVN